MKYSNELYIKSIGTASITSRFISADVIEEGEPVYKAAICVNTTDLMLKVCSLLKGHIFENRDDSLRLTTCSK